MTDMEVASANQYVSLNLYLNYANIHSKLSIQQSGTDGFCALYRDKLNKVKLNPRHPTFRHSIRALATKQTKKTKVFNR